MGAIDRDALRLVDGGGIAVVDLGIGLEVEPDAAAIVQPSLDPLGVEPLDGSEGAVLDVKISVIQE